MLKTVKADWPTHPAHPAEQAGSYTLRQREAQAIKADLARNAAKNSGALQREEADRAHRREVAEGVHQ